MADDIFAACAYNKQNVTSVGVDTSIVIDLAVNERLHQTQLEHHS